MIHCFQPTFSIRAYAFRIKKKVEGKKAIHSALVPYSPGGGYGDKDREMGRSMDIRASNDAFAQQLHPIIRIILRAIRGYLWHSWLYHWY